MEHHLPIRPRFSPPCSAMLLCLFALIGCEAPSPTDGLGGDGHQATGPQLRITYQSVLKSVELNQQQLTYTWKTPQQQPGGVPGYRTHQRQATLSRAQLERFQQWVDQHNAFLLASPDMPPDPDDFAASFTHQLLLQQGDRRTELTWSGASRWSDHASRRRLQQAVDQLLDLARQFTGAPSTAR